MATVARALMLARELSRGRLFYGYYIVGLALFSQFIGVGVQGYAFSVFLKPMTEELGWSRADFSGAQSTSTIVMAATGFVIGGLIDRYGGRYLMMLGAVILGGSIIALSQGPGLWQFYLIRSTCFVMGSALMGNLVVNVTLSKWFVRRRGTMIAIASMGVSLAGVAMVPFITVLTSTVGWRMAWVVLGIVVWLAIIVPAWLIMRRQPEDMGLLPDGDTAESLAALEARSANAKRRRLTAANEEQWTRREAMRTKALWLVVIAYGVANIGLSGMLLHFIPFFTDNGFKSGTAAFLFSMGSLSALICKPIWGYLSDLIHPRYLAAVAFVLAGASIIVILQVVEAGSAAHLMPFVLLWGFGIGATIPLQETVWASYFGRRHLGEIRSVAMPFSIAFSSTGPLLAGFLFDVTGSYVVPFTIFAVSYLVGTVLIISARPPTRLVPISEAVAPA